MGPRAGLVGRGDLAFIGIRFPDRPARTESVYLLSCRGHLTTIIIILILITNSLLTGWHPCFIFGSTEFESRRTNVSVVFLGSLTQMSGRHLKQCHQFCFHLFPHSIFINNLPIRRHLKFNLLTGPLNKPYTNNETKKTRNEESTTTTTISVHTTGQTVLVI